LDNSIVYKEKEILEQVSLGDEKAFRRLFDHYWDNIYSVAFVFTKSSVLAEEMVQDVFLKVWQKRDQLPGIEKFEGWLFTIARNHILNTLRNKSAEQSFSEDLLQYFKETTNLPEQQLLLKESEQLISRAAAQLPEQQKKVFLLSRGQGMSHEEIARELGLSKLTIKTHMHMALKSMRLYIEKHGGGALLVLCILNLYLPVANQ